MHEENIVPNVNRSMIFFLRKTQDSRLMLMTILNRDYMPFMSYNYEYSTTSHADCLSDYNFSFILEQYFLIYSSRSALFCSISTMDNASIQEMIQGLEERCQNHVCGVKETHRIHIPNNGETTCRQLPKRLPDNSTFFAADATAITLALNYYRHMDPAQRDVIIYSDSMSCLQAIKGEDSDNPLICQILNLLWELSDKCTRVRFCWVPSHCGIEGYEIVDQLANETLDHDIDPLATVHLADL